MDLGKFDALLGRFREKDKRKEPSGGAGTPSSSGSSGVQSVTGGTGVTVDNADPHNPIVYGDQSYDEFIYNSAGAQSGNRYNSWPALMTAITGQDGPKAINFEQNETIPAGNYNLDLVSLVGNGVFLPSGGIVVTLADGVVFTSWVNGKITGALTLYSISTNPIMSITTSLTIYINSFSILATATDPFFSVNSTVALQISAEDAGLAASTLSGILGATSEIFEVTDAGALLILAFGGYGAFWDNDIVKGVGGLIKIRAWLGEQTAFGTPNLAQTNANFSGGVSPLNALLAAEVSVVTYGNNIINDIQTSLDNLDDDAVSAASSISSLSSSVTSLNSAVAKIPDVLFDHYADQGNTTTSETDLYSDTLAAGQLAANGEKVAAKYGGVFVSSVTATRQVRLKFAGNTIFDSGALTLSLSAAWTVDVLLIRVSSTVIRYSITMTTEGAALAAYTAVGELTGLTLSGTNILKITGQAAGTGAATNDIVAKLGTVKWEPVA